MVFRKVVQMNNSDVGKLPIVKHGKKYNKFCLQTQCRICLTQCLNTSLSLGAPLNRSESVNSNPLVFEALELLVNEKVYRGPKYPDTICMMCAGYLKIAYELITQYKTSKKSLLEQLEEHGDIVDNDFLDDEVKKKLTTNNTKVKAPVEIVIGKEKFDINDLFIVEEENDDSCSYNGFLQNLGTCITASFVEKGYQKPKFNIEAPSIVIEKVGQGKLDETENNNFDQDFNSSSKFIKILEESLNPTPIDEEDINRFINEPNTEVIDTLLLENDNEKAAVKSALTLKYKCPFCLKPMSTLSRAKLHSRRCSKNTVTVQCYVCDSIFKSRKELLRHIKAIHLTNIKEAEKFVIPVNQKYKCNICDELFQSQGALFYHYKKHSGKKYGCTKCDKKFFTRSQAKCHIETHNKEKTVVICQICGKGFHYKSGLHYHLKMHSDIRDIQCNFCPRRFYTQTSLKRHELTHTGARPYSCKYCDKKFRSSGETKKHQFLHTGERPFRCKYCDMGFTQMHNLRVHMTTHSGNYECLHCSKAFADSDILRFHLKNKHQIYETQENTEKDETQEQEDDRDEKSEIHKEIVGNDEVLSASNFEYYITEQYEEDEEQTNENADQLFVKSYELRGEVLVETFEHLE